MLPLIIAAIGGYFIADGLSDGKATEELKQDVKFADGGYTADGVEIVVVSKDLEKDGGRKHSDRFFIKTLLRKKFGSDDADVAEAKTIAEKMWQEEWGDSDLVFVEALTDAEYRKKYMSSAERNKMANGGGVREEIILSQDEMLKELQQSGMKINKTQYTEMMEKMKAQAREKGGAWHGKKKYADGGTMQDKRTNIRLKIATIIGVDKALDYLDKQYVVSPFNLIEGAVMRDIININEINEDLWDAAVSEANDIDRSYRDSGQGISSSDMGVFTRDMLSEVGIKFRLVGSKFERIMADGGDVR